MLRASLLCAGALALACSLDRMGTMLLAPGSGGGPSTGACGDEGDCPKATPCASYTCEDGICLRHNEPKDTFVSEREKGDCLREICSAEGEVILDPDDADPFDDGNPCTDDTCENGTPKNDPVPGNPHCGEKEWMKCEEGKCKGCKAAEDCPEGTACQSRTCQDQICGVQNLEQGTEVADNNEKDCWHDVCDDKGQVVTQGDVTETPNPDDNECDDEICTDKGPEHANKKDGEPCSKGGEHCFDGTCSACGLDDDCPAPGSICQVKHCEKGKCEPQAVPDKMLPDPKDGDCKALKCVGGQDTEVADPGDAPADPQGDCWKRYCQGNTKKEEIDVADVSDPPGDCKTWACLDGEPASSINDNDKPADAPGDCKSPVCDDGALKWPQNPQDTPAQTAGDCKVWVCEGDQPKQHTDDGDVPSSPDPGKCKKWVCSGGNATKVPANEGENCAFLSSCCGGDCCATACCSSKCCGLGAWCKGNGECAW
ncbi:MAG: hypothetical protein HY744_33515 [Deltaproteobacteria bacterium]|nr:hypothetical protein [Deltaproteobacteria bacterium]